ncbi:MAG: MarC family protein, partial [Desulfobaccales bacterium]
PQAAGQPPPSLEIASFPLAIPALVTAPGIAAITAFMAIAGSDWTQRGIVLAALLVIMGLNLATLLNIDAISKHGSPLAQRVFGWVLAVLQAALAAQYLINGLVRLGALSPLVS